MFKRSKRSSTRSRQNAAWHKELKQWWIDNDMPVRCELCGGTFGLALAHSRKRREITTKEQYWTVALLCQEHHQQIEFSGHENMQSEIERIIAKREAGG